MNQSQTHNDARIDLKSRAVYYKAIEAAEDMLDGKATMNPEKLQAIAAVADAAACGFTNDKETESEYD